MWRRYRSRAEAPGSVQFLVLSFQFRPFTRTFVGVSVGLVIRGDQAVDEARRLLPIGMQQRLVIIHPLERFEEHPVNIVEVVERTPSLGTGLAQ